MFQFRRFPTYAYFVQRRLMEYCSIGFPHSEISGSKLICSSPKLIAACHVLHRLLMPRHSPCALISLTSSTRSRSRGPLAVVRTSFGSLIRIMQASEFEVFYHITARCCFYPSTERLSPFYQSSTITCFYSVACSSIWNHHSHCSVFKVRLPDLLRPDLSIQPQLSTEIRS